VSAETIKLILEGLFFPIAIGLVIWAITQRKSDKATIVKTLAEAGKVEAESDKTEQEVVIARQTVEAAVQLAEIKTLQEGITAMAQAYREEREALQRELERAIRSSDTCVERQRELEVKYDDMKADVTRYHREVLDMYRRDLYHAHAIRVLTEWIADNLPKILVAFPELPRPPRIDPLPPLHIDPDEDLPNRRWYDSTPAVDPDEQEL
jgi:hypothetical protein